MSFQYAVTLNLAGRPCTVVGGGTVALRKVESLLEEEASVTVISPALCPQLAELAEANRLSWIAAPYRDGQLAGSFLVIAATDRRDVNRAVARWCEAHQVLVNVADSREESSFAVSAAVRRGDLLLAVSTGGVSPAIARSIRERLEEEFGPEYGVMLEIVAAAREEAMCGIKDASKRREFLQRLAEMDLPGELRGTSREEVENKVRACLSSYWD